MVYFKSNNNDIYNHELYHNGNGLITLNNLKFKQIFIPKYKLNNNYYIIIINEANFIENVTILANNLNDVNNYIQDIIYYILGIKEYNISIYQYINNNYILYQNIESLSYFDKNIHHSSFKYFYENY
jgi:hypothetical protein